MDGPLRAFASLPGRVFLDSSVLQTLHEYGGDVYENEPLSPSDRIMSVTHGVENLDALRHIFRVNERAHFEFALSDNSLCEVQQRGDRRYLQWAYDVLDYWMICLAEAGGPSEQTVELASVLDSPRFNYLSRRDRALIRDAVFLGCEAFLTMEEKLPKNRVHLQRELGLDILRPMDYWALLKPWAALWF